MRQRNSKLEFLRRKVLNREIDSRRKESRQLELLVKTDFRKQEFLAKELGRIGKVRHVYKAIPYLSIVCDAKDAAGLSSAFHRLADEKAYSSIAAVISAIDVSNTLTIPETRISSRKSSEGLWNLDAIGAYEAKEIARGEGVKVAVIDTGVDYRHPEISQSFGSAKGYDFIRGNDDPMDFNGHGTHVAGIAVGQNYGIADMADLYALRVLDENGSGTEADAIAAMDWADKHEADAINMSMGSPYVSAALEDMCYYLANKGVLIVAAAGNNGFGANYPAAFGEPVIAVAAVDEQLRHPEFSSIYETNDISAPGVNITSSYIGGYKTLNGTSMAAPHVTGTLAVALSALRKKTDLEQLMEETAEKLGQGNFPERDVFGAGLIRADKLLHAIAKSAKNSSRDYGKELLGMLKEVWG